MFYACSVSTVGSDMLHFWAVQTGRNAWRSEMVLRCNRTIILASAEPEITSANDCTADPALFEPCWSFSLCKSSRIHHLLLIIFFYLCYKTQSYHCCTSLDISEGKVLFKLQTMLSKNRKKSWTLVKCLSCKELHTYVVTQSCLCVFCWEEKEQSGLWKIKTPFPV